MAIIAVSLVTLVPLCEVLTARLARLRRTVVAGAVSGPPPRSGSIVNPRPIPMYHRQARARGAQSGESVLLDDYPRPGQRPTTAASGQTGASGSQLPPELPPDMPTPRLSRPHPAVSPGSSWSRSAPGSSTLLARRPSAAGGSSAKASFEAEARYCGPGVLVTTTVDVVRSSFVDVRMDSEDDVMQAFPDTITTWTAGKPHAD